MKQEKEEDGDKKKGDNDDEEEIEENRRDVEDMQDSMVVEEGKAVKYPLVPVATFAAPASRFLPARRS